MQPRAGNLQSNRAPFHVLPNRKAAIDRKANSKIGYMLMVFITITLFQAWRDECQETEIIPFSEFEQLDGSL